MKFFLVLNLLLLLAASDATCRNNAHKVSNQQNMTSSSPKKDQAAALTAANTSSLKTGNGTGLITKINLEIGSVELKHDEIKGMMPAMQMEFYVSDKKQLELLKVGDKVAFTVENNNGSEQITKIAKVE